MNLLQLAHQYPRRAEGGVPDWMLGHFRRRCISFADGRSDERTQVHWLQSRHFTIDLRLPDVAPPPARPLRDYDAEQLRQLANHEGWAADSLWDGQRLSWQGGVSLQLHNRWPEPALLQRVGNCMIEFAPSGAYVEDWRLQASGGPLIGLRLLEECDADDGRVLHRGGGLIICGRHAGLVRGRPVSLDEQGASLRDRARQAAGDAAALAALFACDTLLAVDRGDGYRVERATLPARRGERLPLDGFEKLADGRLRQAWETSQGPRVRLFEVDTLEPDWQAAPNTAQDAQAGAWFDAERETLERHLRILE